MATIKDVAKLAGVSVSTASMALNGKGPVSEATRRRVVEAARALQYRPNAIARGLVTRKTRTVGLVLADLTDPYFHEIAKGAEAVLSAAGYAMLLADTDRSPEKERRSIEALCSHQVEGLILAGSGLGSASLVGEVRRHGIEVVAVGPHAAGVPSVGVDNEAVGRAIARHLIERGRRRIAFVGGPPGLGVSEARLQGFLQALAEAELEPFRIIPSDFTPAGGYRAAAQLMAERNPAARPDAVVAANDQMAIGVIKGARELGLTVPAEVAVAGIGDIPTAVFTEPPLTTVALPIRAMGEQAALLLLRALGEAAEEEEEERGAALDFKLVVRAST